MPTYSRYNAALADAVNLQSLLERLSDFLLQSGFGGDPYQHPFLGDFDFDSGFDSGSTDSLRDAILKALVESDQLTPGMIEALRGGGEGEGDQESEARLAELLDGIVERLRNEGWLDVDAAPRMPGSETSLSGHGNIARAASRNVHFRLTGKGIDFLGYKALRHILGSLGRSTAGSHDTPWLATGVEADAASKPYEFGDVLNLDVNATLSNALARADRPGVPIDIDYADLVVRQAEYRSSCATVLMLDTSHSMILYGEDRFTPAKKVALALTHLIRTQFPGDTIRVVLFHDSAEEIPLATLGTAQVGPYHTNTARGLELARRILMSQKKDMRQIVMITDGKPSAMTLPDGMLYRNAMGLDGAILAHTLAEVSKCRRSGIVINTFMLARDRALVEFVKEMSRISRGKAYFTSTMSLGQFILMDFLRRKTRTVR